MIEFQKKSKLYQYTFLKNKMKTYKDKVQAESDAIQAQNSQ